MFWNKKTPLEKQREMRLAILQLEKLIDRGVNNSNNALKALDKSRTEIYGKEKNENLRILAAVKESSSVDRFIEANKSVLEEIKGLVKGEGINLPRSVKEVLKTVEKRNDEIHVSIRVRGMTLDRIAQKENSDPIYFLTSEMTIAEDIRADLLNVIDSFTDFRELTQRHFSISSFSYVHESRLDELRNIESNEFDISKTIRLCEELNNAFDGSNYLSVGMLLRAILDHIPPIFGFNTFVEVANNYGGKSLKRTLQNLQISSRNIADTFLHQPIRNKESLPNENQIDFRNDLDVLLGEIVRVLK